MKTAQTPDMNHSRAVTEGEERVRARGRDVNFIHVKEVSHIRLSRARDATKITDSSTGTSDNHAIIWKCRVTSWDVDSSSWKIEGERVFAITSLAFLPRAHAQRGKVIGSVVVVVVVVHTKIARSQILGEFVSPSWS